MYFHAAREQLGVSPPKDLSRFLMQSARCPTADAEHLPCTMHAFCVSSPKQENKRKLAERYGLNSFSAAFCIPTTSLEPTPRAGASLLLASAPSAPVITQPWLHSGSHSRGRGQRRCICTTSCKICRVGSIHQLSRQSPHGCG